MSLNKLFEVHLELAPTRLPNRRIGQIHDLIHNPFRSVFKLHVNLPPHCVFLQREGHPSVLVFTKAHKFEGANSKRSWATAGTCCMGNSTFFVSERFEMVSWVATATCALLLTPRPPVWPMTPRREHNFSLRNKKKVLFHLLPLRRPKKQHRRCKKGTSKPTRHQKEQLPVRDKIPTRLKDNVQLIANVTAAQPFSTRDDHERTNETNTQTQRTILERASPAQTESVHINLASNTHPLIVNNLDCSVLENAITHKVPFCTVHRCVRCTLYLI